MVHLRVLFYGGILEVPMTKIGSATGGIQPPFSDVDSNQPTKTTTTEAPVQKTAPTAADATNASEAKGVMNSAAELMKKKLQEGVKLQSGQAPESKTAPSPHTQPLHPAADVPVSRPHPSLKLNINDGGRPQTLINEKPAARLTEEEKK